MGEVRCSGVDRRRTVLIAAASALGMTATLAGCGGSAGSGDVTLRLVAADYGDSKANSSQKYWDELVKAYEAGHPGPRFEVTVYPSTDVDRKVKEMVARGDAPDMAQIGTYADYADKGELYKAEEVLSIFSCQAELRRAAHRCGEDEPGAVRHAVRGLHPAALLQQEAVRRRGFSARRRPGASWPQTRRR